MNYVMLLGTICMALGFFSAYLFELPQVGWLPVDWTVSTLVTYVGSVISIVGTSFSSLYSRSVIAILAMHRREPLLFESIREDLDRLLEEEAERAK